MNKHSCFIARLCVRVEASPAASKRLDDKAFTDQVRDQISLSILAELLRLNSEFGAYVLGDKQSPEVQLFPFGDSTHFPQGVKHKYV